MARYPKKATYRTWVTKLMSCATSLRLVQAISAQSSHFGGAGGQTKEKT